MSDEPGQTTVDLGPLEADFAVMYADLARIAEMPVSLGTAAAAALNEIINEGVTEAASETALGRSFQKAIYGVMKESAATDMNGKMMFNIDKQSLAVHGVPVMLEAVTAVQGQVQSLLDGLNGPGAPPPTVRKPGAKPDAARPAKFKLDLMSLFGGVIQGLADQAKKPPKKG